MPDALATPPMLAVVGKKHVGKTTLVSRLCAELTRRGHRIMVLKHGSHTFNLDPAATDTYRHYHEGQAARVAMASPDKFALVSRWDEELAPETIVSPLNGSTTRTPQCALRKRGSPVSESTSVAKVAR